MKNLILKKQKHTEPDFDELSRMIFDLKDFLDEDSDFEDRQWMKNLNTILDFQDLDGSFKLFDSYKIPSDARVDFCYLPTYLATAILMKAYMDYSSKFSLKETVGLKYGLKMSCAKNLRGHGYEALRGQIEALNIFMKAGLREFMDLNSELCPEFSQMIEKIIAKYRDMEAKGNFTGPWGESYEDEIRAVNRYFRQRKVFVYGTLMSGEPNHHYLENADFLGKAVIEGYDMYNVGWYPAIVSGEGLTVGELYEVPLDDMPAIDMLEGEGTLYLKKCESLTDGEGNKTLAFVYVYLEETGELERIPAWKSQYLWYVAYGSNMDYERFMCYIKGGSYEGSSFRSPCSDTSLPLAVRPVEIPYDMYFANASGSWDGCGVSFLDVSGKGKALGVAYLITKEQFEHVSAEENGGRTPAPGYGWYENIIDLDEMDGFEVKTITNKNLRNYNEPCRAYLKTLKKGIRQNWPEMTEGEIEDYLKSCIR